MALAIFLILLLIIIAIGVPIGFALIVASIGLMFYLDAFDTQLVAQTFIKGADSFALLAVPFFILAGELMNAGGISKRIVNFAMSIFGHIKGGLGYVAIFASVLFAGLSGSAVADAAALGAILIPMMAQSGYNKESSAGLIASGSLIAPVIPPSIPMIIYGVSSGASITKLFMAGIVPGILLAISLIITWWLLMRKNTDLVTQDRKSFKEIIKATLDSIWALLLPVFIIVGLRFGVFTPTEAGAVAVFYALFIGMFIYRELKLKDLYRVLVSAAKSTATVMFLVAAAMVSAWLITIANVPMAFANLLEPLIDNPMLLLFAILILVLLLGCVMDLTPLILILTPVLMPVVNMAGIDPVYFGIIFILTGCIGLLTPPVGTVLTVTSSVAKMKLESVLKGLWPFLIAELAVIILLILFPDLVMVPLEWLTK